MAWLTATSPSIEIVVDDLVPPGYFAVVDSQRARVVPIGDDPSRQLERLLTVPPTLAGMTKAAVRRALAGTAWPG